MYLYLTPDDDPLCEVCAQAKGRAFLASHVGKKGFSPLDGKCANAVPCEGYLIGIYGGWLEARELLQRLQKAPKPSVVRLSVDETIRLTTGDWKKSVSADTDRVNVHLLQALCREKTDVDRAIEGYRYVMERAKEERHEAFLVPAHLRLLALLLRAGREEEARQVMVEFERLFPMPSSASVAPSPHQRKLFDNYKSQLWKRESLKVSA